MVFENTQGLYNNVETHKKQINTYTKCVQHVQIVNEQCTKSVYGKCTKCVRNVCEMYEMPTMF